MTKDENIFNLYDRLNKSGARGEACRYIADLCNVKMVTVKGHWIFNREFPDHLDDGKKDSIIGYLQNAVAMENATLHTA